MDFDRTFFMDGLEMDVNAMTRDEAQEESDDEHDYDYRRMRSEWK